MTTNDIAILAHTVNLRMNHGQSREDIKAARRKWTYGEVRELAADVVSRGGHPADVADRVAYRVWHCLGVIDANRRSSGLTEFYRSVG